LLVFPIYLTGQGDFAMGRGQYLNGRKILMTGRKILPQIGKAYIGIDKYMLLNKYRERIRRLTTTSSTAESEALRAWSAVQIPDG